jgi:predicted glycoside hydrolase/deacetylase ChbG (UPF0249 family)
VAKYLIVNADDFGLTGGVTRGILEGHRHGIVTSTSAMVNLSGLERSRELAREAPALSVGLHINLTLGAPILPAVAVPSLVSEAGHFVRDRDRLGEAGNASEIRREIAAQAERFEEVFGRRPTHVDTHYHMHRLPRMFALVLGLAVELGVPARALTPEMAGRIRARGLLSPDRAVGEVGPDTYWTAERLRGVIQTMEEGVTELICHPGHVDAALSISSYCAQRAGELRALSDPEVRAALAAAGVNLIGYQGLAAAAGDHA